MAYNLRPQPVVFRLSVPEPADQVLVRERLMDVVKRRLSRVTLANGYSCDCGLDVQEGKLVGLTPPVPSMNFWDGDETSEKLAGVEHNTLSLTIELYQKGTSTSTSTSIARTARRMAADVRKALLWNDDYTRLDPSLDGLGDGLKYRASDLVLGLNPESWIGVILDFQVTYYTVYGNQYRSKE